MTTRLVYSTCTITHSDPINYLMLVALLVIKFDRYDYGPMLLRGYHSELIKGLGTDHMDYSMDQLYQEFDSSVPAAIALGLNTVSVSKNNLRLKLLKYVNYYVYYYNFR